MQSPFSTPMCHLLLTYLPNSLPVASVEACSIYMSGMTSVPSLKLHMTTLPSNHLLVHSILSLFLWDGLTQFLFSMRMSPTFYDLKSHMSLYLSLMMSLSRALTQPTNNLTAPTRCFAKTPAFGTLSRSIFRMSTRSSSGWNTLEGLFQGPRWCCVPKNLVLLVIIVPHRGGYPIRAMSQKYWIGVPDETYLTFELSSVL